jgi:hypothetical protein
MLFKSQVFTQASGSVGGLTYSRNRGGMYTRARATPGNPNTPQQQVVRAAVAQLTSLWVGTLTQVQREAWETYATNVTLPNRLGEQVNIGALGHYIRSNVPRLQAALTRVDAAPTTFDLGDLSSLSLAAADASADTISVNVDVADPFWIDAGSALLVYSSEPRNPSITYFKGPYRFGFKAVGGGVPATPVVGAAGHAIGAAGQRIFVRAVQTLADGRLSLAQRMTILAVA